MNNGKHVRPGVRQSRSLIQASVRIHTPTRHWNAQVLDVSLSGIRIRRPEAFDLTAGQVTELQLIAGEAPSLQMRGRVVRLGESDVAVRYELLSPAQESGLRELIGRSGQLRDDFDDVDVD